MELKKLEDRREFLQPVMDNVSKEIKEYGMIKTFLPEATALERAVTYRDKKIKPLFIEMKNKIGAMAAQVKNSQEKEIVGKVSFRRKSKSMKKQKRNWQKFRKIIRNYLVRKKYCRDLRIDITDFYACWGKIW